MAIRFAMSGGNFIFSAGPNVAGIWASAVNNAALVNNAPAGRSNTFAHTGGASQWTTPNLGGPYTGVIPGWALYPGNIVNNQQILTFLDNLGNAQCSLSYNASGQPYFALGRNNTTPIGTYSTQTVLLNQWQFFEAKVISSNSGAGSCELRINGVAVLTLSSVTNAVNGNGIAQVIFQLPGISGNSYATDYYVLDTGTGTNRSYLGDITVAELFANGAGVNQAWTANTGPFTLTSVNGAGVYSGTITGGGSNAYVGYNFVISGFTNSGNNGTFVCTASSVSSLTLTNTTISETHSGSAAFQAIVQAGINQTGTRPNDDVTYIFSQTTNQISDFTHQPLALTGSIAGAVHQTFGKKDDAGTRIMAQVCLSGGTTEVSPNISLGSSYAYYQDILEQDPNTSSNWTLTGLNNATFGAKELT